ncbi:MAG: hypothetical protein D6805_02105 [Planctomycetota bacterium]|nr:MAG: hypothetical protein D6805_02105 [Planctomycetota bacterium]
MKNRNSILHFLFFLLFLTFLLYGFGHTPHNQQNCQLCVVFETCRFLIPSVHSFVLLFLVSLSFSLVLEISFYFPLTSLLPISRRAPPTLPSFF